MQDFTIGDLGVFIGTIGGVVTSVLIVLQKSKCKKINCGCCSCEREIPPVRGPNAEEQAEEGQQPIPLNQPPAQDLLNQGGLPDPNNP